MSYIASDVWIRLLEHERKLLQPYREAMVERERLLKSNAIWHYSIETECPHCKEDIDIAEDPDFWVDNNLEFLGSKENFQVDCPKCGKTFLVDITY